MKAIGGPITYAEWFSIKHAIDNSGDTRRKIARSFKRNEKTIRNIARSNSWEDYQKNWVHIKRSNPRYQDQINALRERVEDLENQMKAVNYLILKGR